MRPTFDRLPVTGYQDNPAVDALLSYYDERLVTEAEKAGNFWRTLSDLSTPRDLPEQIEYQPLPLPTRLEVEFNATANGYYRIQWAYGSVDLSQHKYLKIVDSGGKLVDEYYYRSSEVNTYHIRLNAGSYHIYSEYRNAPTIADGLTTKDDTGQTKPYSLAMMVTPEEDSQLGNRIDYLAYLLGYRAEHWDRKWQPSIKREILKHTHELQDYRGTEKALRRSLDCHSIHYVLWGLGGLLRLPCRVPARFGYRDRRLWLLLPLAAHRSSREFTEARRIIGSEVPLGVEAGVCFDKFYVGFSRLGEPVFT